MAIVCKLLACLLAFTCWSSLVTSDEVPANQRTSKQLLLVPSPGYPAFLPADIYNHPQQDFFEDSNPSNPRSPQPTENVQGRRSSGSGIYMMNKNQKSSGDDEEEQERCPKPQPLAVITSCGNGLGTVVSAAPRGVISYYVNRPAPAAGRSLEEDPTAPPAPGNRHGHPFHPHYPTYHPNPSVNCTYAIAADQPNTKVMVKCLNISPNIKMTVAQDAANHQELQQNAAFTSTSSYLILNADLSQGLGYFHFPAPAGGFTCIWSHVSP